MYVLALHEDSNANLSLFKDGEILFSIAEERLTRRKHQGGIPYASIGFVLEKYGLTFDSIDVIICGNKYHPLPRVLGKYFPTGEHQFLGVAQKLSLYYQQAIYRSRLLRDIVEACNKILLKKKFRKKVELVNHHEAHAYSSYMTSGFNDALVITADNYGDGIAAAVFEAHDGNCTRLYASSAMHSPGQYYGELAQYIGFHPLMAGKMTGLAAYGDPNAAYAIMEKLFSLSEDKRDFVLPPLLWKTKHSMLFKGLKQYTKEDIAAAAQKRFEDVVIGYVQEAVHCTGLSRVALAGGIFGNVRLNQKISELDEVTEIFVHPGMNDQGISLGAGLQYLAGKQHIKPFRLQHVFLGPEYTDAEIKQELDNAGVHYHREENIEQKVAQLLSQGYIVARFNGRLEYGPRALGNRSILYQATDPTVNTWLNKKLHRSECMPFAPVTLKEYTSQCYERFEKWHNTARFMTVSVRCTDLMKKLSPAVVHVDGTARPQVLSSEDNPSYFTILKEYHVITGIPSIINTSFNMHEEPIVTSPKDAVRAFKSAQLDFLAIGSYLVKADQLNCH